MDAGACPRQITVAPSCTWIPLAVADVLPHAQHKQVDLGVAGELPAEAVKVNGQSEALRVLLRNLLDNAVKYTPASGRVDVSLSVKAGQALLRVEDSGPGIADAERERVFDRFFRASQAEAASSESGSGLGLAIVQAIAVRHGATLQLGQSQRLGGLQVDVRFPAGAGSDA